MEQKHSGADIFFGLIGILVGVFLVFWAIEKYPTINLFGRVIMFILIPCITGFLGYKFKIFRALIW